MRHANILLAITLLNSACSTERPPARPVTIDVTPPSAAMAPRPAAATPPEKPSCAQLSRRALAHANEVIAAALAEVSGERAPALGDVQAARPAFIGKCFPAPGGAWVVGLQAAKFDTGYSGLDLQWSLEHLSDTGAKVSVVPTAKGDDPKPDEFNYASSPETYEIDLAPYDYDGDGAPEIIVQFRGRYHEGEEFSYGRIYTLKHGKIALFSPAKGLDFDSAKDVDGDGRPDLVVYGPFSAVGEYCGSGFGYRVAGPPLIAHARADGSFSLNDDVARQAARKECPARPARIVEKGKEGDTELSARNVACARIWGVSTADLRKRITAECKPSTSSDICPPDACRDGDLLKRWADIEPPLVLQ